MARGTILFIFILTLIATFMLGINVGKKIQKAQFAANTAKFPTPSTVPPTQTPSPTVIIEENPQPSEIQKVSAVSTFQDKTCGLSFSYPGSFINTKTINERSVILTNPDNENEAIAVTCADKIPRPPVASDKIESIILDGTAGTLYHDKDPQDRPRDEIIIRHPDKNIEIILAGFGPTFEQALASFRFLP